MPESLRYARLTEELCDWLRPNGALRPSVGFRDVRSHLRTALNFQFKDENISRMLRGEVVTLALVEAFQSYLREMRVAVPREVRRFEECDQPDTDSEPSSIFGDVWRGGARELWGFAFNNFEIPDEAYCADDEDVEMAANAIRIDVGVKQSRRRGLTDDQALAIAEQVMGVTLDEFAATLIAWKQRHPRTLLFAVAKEKVGKGQFKFRRVGVSCSLGLSQGAFEQFRLGQYEPLEISTEDIVVPSRWLHLSALAEARNDFKSRVGRGQALVRTCLWQAASLLEPVKSEHTPPELLVFAGTDENGRRSSVYSFVPTGHHTPRTKHEIMELRYKPPRPTPFVMFSPYQMIRAVLGMYQESIALHDAFSPEGVE